MRKSLTRQYPKTLITFYILVFYIIIQFFWWTYHMSQLNIEIYLLKQDINQRFLTNDTKLEQSITSKLEKRQWMVIGESTVFFALLIFGIIKTRSAFIKEIALNNKKKNFLLSITHELRTPITSLKLGLETLKKHELPNKTKETLLNNNLIALQHLSNLIDNLLTANSLDNKAYVLQKEAINVSTYIEELLQTNFTNHYQRFILDIKPNIIANIDKNAFASIVLNIVENAIKYSEPNTPININLNTNNEHINLEIADQGQGIANNEKQNIFEKFYRIGNEATRKTKGTGIGLYLVKFFIDQHKGKISVLDNQPQGTIFKIILPNT